MFSPNGNYGRFKVERAAVFNGNFNRITGNRFIRGDNTDSNTLTGAVIYRDVVKDGYLYQRPGMLTALDWNSTRPALSSVFLGVVFVTAFKGGTVEEFARENSFFGLSLTEHIL